MAFTAWTAPREWRNRIMTGGTGALVGPDWLATAMQKVATAARVEVTRGNDASFVQACWHWYAAGTAGYRYLQIEWADVLPPLAPAGAHHMEWRSLWNLYNNDARPPRTYWDARGEASAPASGTYRYARWPFKPGFDKRLWRFGDPALYRWWDWMVGTGKYHAHIVPGGLTCRFEY